MSKIPYSISRITYNHDSLHRNPDAQSGPIIAFMKSLQELLTKRSFKTTPIGHNEIECSDDEVRLFAEIFGNPRDLINVHEKAQLDNYINLRKAQIDAGLNLGQLRGKNGGITYFHKSPLLEKLDISERTPIIYTLGMTQCALMSHSIFKTTVTAHFDIVYKLITKRDPNFEVKRPDLLGYSVNPEDSFDYSKPARLLIEAKGRSNKKDAKDSVSTAVGQLSSIDKLLDKNKLSEENKDALRAVIDNAMPVVSIAYFDDSEQLHARNKWKNLTYILTSTSSYGTPPDSTSPLTAPRDEEFGGLLLIANLLPICQIIKISTPSFNATLVWAFIPQINAWLALPKSLYDIIVENFIEAPLPDYKQLLEYAKEAWSIFQGIDMAAYKGEINELKGQVSCTGFAWILNESLDTPLKDTSASEQDNDSRDKLSDRLRGIEVEYLPKNSEESNWSSRSEKDGFDSADSQDSCTSIDIIDDAIGDTIEFIEPKIELIEPKDDCSEAHEEEDDQEYQHTDGSAQ